MLCERKIKINTKYWMIGVLNKNLKFNYLAQISAIIFFDKIISGIEFLPH